MGAYRRLSLKSNILRIKKVASKLRPYQNACNIAELFSAMTKQQYGDKTYLGEVAIVGYEDERDRFGRKLPECITKLLNEAENDLSQTLSMTGFEDTFVLTTHPEAVVVK
jgi:hypothetical protein